MAEKNLIICDSGNGAIRLVTSSRAVIPLLTCIREYLAAFGLPKQEHPLTLDRCEAAGKQLSELFEEMAIANAARSSRGFKGEGPDGNVSEVNRSQLEWMLEGIKIIRDEFTLLGHAHLIALVNPAAMQELCCELFFTNMRKNNPMPSIIEYFQRRANDCDT